MLVFVTGGSGFIGSRLIERLIGAGHRVRSAGRSPVRVHAGLIATGTPRQPTDGSEKSADPGSRLDHVAADFF
ncbi:MAG TPA: NAD-dependent epimerase/dehydratase family protein, partial [Burkholderiaceae bacterium]|nr:NAD-dependent epimerase/dehydratase family protein [Burkholderiaceae bacterium]